MSGATLLLLLNPSEPTPAPDLPAALRAWFDEDEELIEAFPSGLVLSRQPAGGRYPSITVGWREMKPGLSLEDGQYALTATIFAAGEDAVVTVADLVVSKLEDPTRTPLTFTRRDLPWIESAVLPGDVAGPDSYGRSRDADSGVDADIWRIVLPYELRVVRADLVPG